MNYDVIIVGGGASGLMAAWELLQAGRSVLILEARNRLGGRIHTKNDNRFSVPIEMGAEFVHGKLPLTEKLMKQAGLSWKKVDGSLWHKQGGRWFREEQIEEEKKVIKALKGLESDMTVAEFLERYFKEDEATQQEIKGYVEGYYAADIERASALDMLDELEHGADQDYRIEGGYGTLIQFLEKEIRNRNGGICLETPVTEIHWRNRDVEIRSGFKSFSASQVLITLPLGVLQAPAIAFHPALPQLQQALQKLGYGPAIKIILEFTTPFWQEDDERKNLSMVFSDALIPTWWTQYPNPVPVITGWTAGGMAKNLVHFKKEVLLNKALESLSQIFDKPLSELKQSLKACFVNNWYKGPYAKGAYSYTTVDGEAGRILITDGIEDTLYFAGEGWHNGLVLGTVEAALQSGRDTAHKMIRIFVQ